MTAGAGTYAVIVADDFGRSSAINRAVEIAHDKGVVTAASIMAGGKRFLEAAATARRMKRLSVGLHLTLVDGRAVLPPGEIPGLVDSRGYFERTAWRAWLRCSRPGLTGQIEKEIAAQFGRLESAGIKPTHVDGHHHLHMHPRVFPLVCSQAARFGARWVRIPREPFSQLRLTDCGPARIIEWIVFRVLGRLHVRTARRQGLRINDQVFGLAQTGRMDEKGLLKVLGRDLPGRIEIFTHPDSVTPAGIRELATLTAPSVRSRIKSAGITLAGYRDLEDSQVGAAEPAPAP